MACFGARGRSSSESGVRGVLIFRGFWAFRRSGDKPQRRFGRKRKNLKQPTQAESLRISRCLALGARYLVGKNRGLCVTIQITRAFV